jgi:dethiobiotin synthetase
MSRSSVQVRSLAPSSVKPWESPGVLSFVVCGTDTGVGKTWAGVRVLNALKRAGVPIAVAKPVESGVVDTGRPEDAVALAAVTGQPLDQVCPWPLPEPVAPARELARLGIVLPNDQLRDAILATHPVDATASTRAVRWVETAGGVASPLTETLVSGQVPALIGAPAILVVADTLGAIHHTTVAAMALRTYGAELFGIVLNDRDGSHDPAQENIAWIARACPDTPIWRTPDALAAAILEAVRRDD